MCDGLPTYEVIICQIGPPYKYMSIDYDRDLTHKSPTLTLLIGDASMYEISA